MVGQRSFVTSDSFEVELSQYGRFKIAIHGILDLMPVRRTTRVLFPLKKLRKFLAAPAAILKIKITHNTTRFQNNTAGLISRTHFQFSGRRKQ